MTEQQEEESQVLGDAGDDVDAALNEMITSLKGKKSDKSKKDKKSKKSKDSKKGKETSGEKSSKKSKEPSDLYDYDDMLQMVYDKLRANNPDLVKRTTATLPPPQVERSGTNKISWMNFDDICATMKRPKNHVYDFFLSELGTTGSIDGSGHFLIKGKFTPKSIESLLRKYIKLYVSCASCNGVNTTLVKDPVTRMHFMECKSCGASRSVDTISKGFHATVKGERKAARNAN